MASTIQVDKVQDTGGNTILSSNSTGTFTNNLPANLTGATGTLAIAQGGTGAATLAAAGLSMTPSFRVTLSGNQTLANTTTTLISFDTNSGTATAGACWDTNSAWNTSTYRFTVPAGEAGKYQFNWATYVSTLDLNERMVQFLFLNGSSTNYGDTQWHSNRASGDASGTGTVTLELSVADYLELKIWANAGTTSTLSSARTFFAGYKLIGI